jgi:CBS domain-containing protein
VPRHLAAGRIFVRTRWNGSYLKAFDSQIAQLRLTRLPDLQTQFKKLHSGKAEEDAMKVNEIMTHEVETVSPNETLQDAAKMMASLDAGALPVGENDQLVGMITDRDIAIRGVARGKGPEAKVRDVMTEEVKYCFDDQDVNEIAQNMADIQVRRLPVVNRSKRLVGIVSLADVAQTRAAGHALRGISQPGGEHTQTG